VTAQLAPKGQPPRVGANAAATPNVITSPADGFFQYAQASQFAVADGRGATSRSRNPFSRRVTPIRWPSLPCTPATSGRSSRWAGSSTAH
jgi:hypothetical protein